MPSAPSIIPGLGAPPKSPKLQPLYIYIYLGLGLLLISLCVLFSCFILLVLLFVLLLCTFYKNLRWRRGPENSDVKKSEKGTKNHEKIANIRKI